MGIFFKIFFILFQNKKFYLFEIIYEIMNEKIVEVFATLTIFAGARKITLMIVTV